MATHDIVDYTTKINGVFLKNGNVADVQTTATATKSYAVGDYLIYNATLYKVTVAITSGGTITPGTNVTAVVLTDELGEGVPSGGTAGQIIIKNSSTDGDAGWQTIDSTPTSSSTKPISSGGVYTALSNKQNTLTFDSTPTSSSTNPVTSGGVYTALSGKQATLTFDSTPTASSTNPVTSDGIKTAVDAKATITVTTTDPGTGSSLAANTLLVVVEA